MARPPSDDEQDTPRPRWLAWGIGLLAACIVLGMVNLAWLMLTGKLGPTVDKSAAAPASPGSAPSVSSALPPSAASSCMRCHGIERRFVGPAFVNIAERYRDRADAQPYLVGKIVNGSVGEWGASSCRARWASQTPPRSNSLPGSCSWHRLRRRLCSVILQALRPVAPSRGDSRGHAVTGWVLKRFGALALVYEALVAMIFDGLCCASVQRGAVAAKSSGSPT